MFFKKLGGLFVLCTLFISSQVCAVAYSKAEKLEDLDQAIAAIIKKEGVPSLAYAIVRKGENPQIRVFHSDGSIAPSNANARPYRIASISKMFVGIAVMQLVESGRVSLSDNLSDVLPQFKFVNAWQDSHPVKVAHLLEHTTGWDEISLAEFAFDNNKPLSMAASLAINEAHRESRWPPGTRHAYTNSGATVAAHLVETLTGMNFYEYVQQHIFEPLEMNTATYDPQTQITGFHQGQVVDYKNILMRPSGAVSASIIDMSKLLHFFINRGNGLLNEQTVSLMERSQTTNAGHFKAGYGLSNYARYYDGWQYRGHDGALPGWLSELNYSPTQGAGFVVLQNSDQSTAYRQVIKLISAYLATQFSPPAFSTTTVPEVWQQKSGYYRYINPRISTLFFLERLSATYTLTVDKKTAVFSQLLPPGWKRKLSWDESNGWVNERGEPVMTLATDPVAGEVIHYGDRVLTKVSLVNAWADKVTLFAWLLCLFIAFIYSLIWPINWLRNKINDTLALKNRIFLSASMFSTLMFICFLVVGLLSPIHRLGEIGVISIGLLVSSLLQVIICLYACWQIFFVRISTKKGVLYWFIRIFLVSQIIVQSYLAWFGIIGICAWQ